MALWNQGGVIMPEFSFIAKTVLTSETNSVIFSSIPQTYKQLYVLVKGRDTNSSITDYSTMNAKINNNAGGDYINQSIQALASGALTLQGRSVDSKLEDVEYIHASVGTQRFSLWEQYFFQYNTTSTHGVVGQMHTEVIWTSQARGVRSINYYKATGTNFNSLNLNANFNNFAIGSSFYLYGIG
jgi:hypothetical protein